MGDCFVNIWLDRHKRPPDDENYVWCRNLDELIFCITWSKRPNRNYMKLADIKIFNISKEFMTEAMHIIVGEGVGMLIKEH